MNILHIDEIIHIEQPEQTETVGEHEEGSEQKEHIAEQHHPSQSLDNEVVALVSLFKLHQTKTQGAHGKEIGSPRLKEDGSATSYNHHQSSEKEDDSLHFIQLIHGYSVLLFVCHRLAQRYLRRRLS